MEFILTDNLKVALRKANKRNPQITKKSTKQLLLFGQNHKHPSLRTHKLKGDLKEIWSISIDRNFRMLYYLEDNQAVFFDLGTHDEVYKK